MWNMWPWQAVFTIMPSTELAGYVLPTGMKFMLDSLKSLGTRGSKLVRLDAFGYATKTPGTRCFFQVPLHLNFRKLQEHCADLFQASHLVSRLVVIAISKDCFQHVSRVTLVSVSRLLAASKLRCNVHACPHLHAAC